MLHTEVGGELLQTLIRRVDGGEGDVLALTRQLVIEGRDHLALAAPRSVEIDHQVLGGRHKLFELLLRLHLHDVLSHEHLVRGRLGGAGLEVVQTALGVDRLFTGLPVRRAHLAVLRDELERLDQTEGFVHAATHGQVVHGDLLDHTLRVDDEEAAAGDAQVVHQNAVLGGDLLGVVADDGDLHAAKASLLARSLDPSQMRLHRIAGAGDQLRVQLLELLRTVAEGDDLRGAHKGEVLGIEEQDDVFAYPSQFTLLHYPCSHRD